MAHQSASGVQGQNRSLTFEEEFLAVLMRFHLGLLLEGIAKRFEVRPSTISRLFATWIRILAVELIMKSIFPWPSKEQIKAKLPGSFRRYPNTRIVIDCSDSIYKGLHHYRDNFLLSYIINIMHNTFKVLIGISLGGVITFVSELWGGRVFDRMITEKSGLLELLEPGDSAMADRGFHVGDVLHRRCVTLNIPPFLGGQSQLTS